MRDSDASEIGAERALLRLHVSLLRQLGRDEEANSVERDGIGPATDSDRATDRISDPAGRSRFSSDDAFQMYVADLWESLRDSRDAQERMLDALDRSHLTASQTDVFIAMRRTDENFERLLAHLEKTYKYRGDSAQWDL